MNRERIRESWVKFLQGLPLSPEEESELCQAFKGEEEVRQEILKDLKVNGRLRSLGEASKSVDAFERRFFGRLLAEDDASRFIAKVESRMEQTPQSSEEAGKEPRMHRSRIGPPSSRKGAARATKPGKGRLFGVLALVAASLIGGLVFFFSTPDPGPGQQSSVAVGTIEASEGQVYATEKDRKIRIEGKRSLFPGQGITTEGAGSRATLTYGDGTRIEVEPETVIADIFDVDAPPAGTRGKRLFLARGGVGARVAKQRLEQPMIVRTPQGEARVLGTTLRIVVNPNPKQESTRLEVTEGKVLFKRLQDGKTVDVLSGHYAVAAAGVELQAKPLPSVPSLPSPWLDCDIGNVGVPGSVTIANQAFTIRGSGADIGETRDAFHFIYRTLNGDGEIVARLASADQEGPLSLPKVGLMMRESLAAEAPSVTVFTSIGIPVYLLQRRIAGEASGLVDKLEGYSLPCWLKLARRGNDLTSSVSSDGTNWKPLQKSASTVFGPTVYIGLAVSSHDNGRVSWAVFEQVTVKSK